MSDYFNGSGTIGFTCDNCGRELLGCTWVNGMKFCAKCYQETFGNTNPFEKELRDKIADLEAKLEQLQKERELDNAFWKQECDSLQKALSEKEKEIEELQQRISDKVTSAYGAEMMARSTQFFLEKEIHELKQAKTDFAIEKLEKVKEYLKDRIKIIEGDECIYDMDEIVGASCENKKTLDKLDQQIKELKEGK